MVPVSIGPQEYIIDLSVVGLISSSLHSAQDFSGGNDRQQSDTVCMLTDIDLELN